MNPRFNCCIYCKRFYTTHPYCDTCVGGNQLEVTDDFINKMNESNKNIEKMKENES